MKKMFKKADIILIIFLCLFSVSMLLPRFVGNDRLFAVIYKNGNEVKRIDLGEVNDSYKIEFESNPASVIKVEHNAISYLSSDCPDKLCVKAGRLTHRGDTAACLPAKTLIVVEGRKKDKNLPDVITY
ncbi:MAG: NusG domain II-containing protein [Eubacteriales bacterium]